MRRILLVVMTMFAFGVQFVSAQDEPMSIVTNHPDFTVKVKRCVASGKTLILDFVAINTGIDNVNKFALAPILTEVYDDEGNTYRGNIGAKVANQTNYTYQRNAFTDLTMETKLLPNVPVKFSLIIPNFSQEATSVALIEIGVVCPKWNYLVNFRSFSQRLAIKNIPVMRK